jgi:hypothetical protein
MNWSKALIGGVVAGIALSLTEFVMHGIIMADVYTKYADVFEQTQANPLHFVLVAVCVAIASALLFSKTRASWGEGIMGGATFGGFLGLFAFFTYFYSPLVFAGYPYYLAWCQGGITFIAMVVVGAVLGLVIKKG